MPALLRLSKLDFRFGPQATGVRGSAALHLAVRETRARPLRPVTGPKEPTFANGCIPSIRMRRDDQNPVSESTGFGRLFKTPTSHSCTKAMIPKSAPPIEVEVTWTKGRQRQ